VFILFIPYDKNYDGLPKVELWHITGKENIPTHFITQYKICVKQKKKFVPNAHPTRYN
jgi:hypothetical protein